VPLPDVIYADNIEAWVDGAQGAYCVRAIAKRTLMDKATAQGDCVEQVEAWYRVARRAAWTTLAEVRNDYRHANLVGDKTVFNIKGNAYRIVVYIDYGRQTIYVKDLLSHAGYDEDTWK